MLSAKTMKTPAHIIRQARTEGRKALFEHEAKELARAAGIAVPRFEVVGIDDGPSLRSAAKKLGFPLALKAVSPPISRITMVFKMPQKT
jgi:acyl-CoA synthetase (NDP forming)